MAERRVKILKVVRESSLEYSVLHPFPMQKCADSFEQYLRYAYIVFAAERLETLDQRPFSWVSTPPWPWILAMGGGPRAVALPLRKQITARCLLKLPHLSVQNGGWAVEQRLAWALWSGRASWWAIPVHTSSTFSRSRSAQHFQTAE